jgi:hypothetical protein
MRSRVLVFGIVLICGFGIPGCGGDDAPVVAGDTTPPQVATASPADGAVGVGLLTPLTLAFSEAMDPATFDGLTVADDEQELGFYADYDAASCTLTVLPVSRWTPDTGLTLGLAGATDLAGNELAPFTAGYGTGGFTCENLTDRLEPDDDTAIARDVAVDVRYPALSTCAQDEDVFRLTLLDTVKVIAETSITFAENSSWNILWVREDMGQYATFNSTTGTGEIEEFPFTFYPGTYYLQLYGPESGAPVLYDLRLVTADPCRDDLYEDNDFPDAAAAVAPGLHEDLTACVLDADWYVLPVTSGRTIRLSVDCGAFTGSRLRRLCIQEPGGAEVEQTFHEESVVSVSLVADADGEALVMVMFWDDSIEYAMTVDILDP